MSQNKQAASAVAMIRPHQFSPNTQTALDNSFQIQVEDADKQQLAVNAYQQVTSMANKLTNLGIKVYLYEDTDTLTPDSVFPNNWFSTHSDGTIALYPMYPKNRRLERRMDLIRQLQNDFDVQQIIDYSPWEQKAIFLEGTGAMVLDHIERIAYTVRSNRANQQALEHFCQEFNYTPIIFNACDHQGVDVYHTNVMMCIGSDFALIGSAMISSSTERTKVMSQLTRSKKTVIELSQQQIAKFCGNALQLMTNNGPILALSQSAYNALSSCQINALEHHVKLVPFDVSAIETAGGSVRCMLASIHLPKP